MYNNALIIREAITKMKRIEFYYDGGGRRIVEPHCLGISKAGNLALRGYQLSGYSESGTVPDWHMFLLTKITNIRILSDSFYSPRPGYRKGDRGMHRIDSEL